ncbi:hypothetical protein EBR96_06960, partial [bacterium]|nr:hypothetical protein [bacterium]
SINYNWADRIGYFFSEFFALIYPYFHNHFVSYLLILLTALGIEWFTYKHFKRMRSGAGKVLLGAVLFIVAAFIVWYVMFQFQSFMYADQMNPDLK